MHYFFDLDNTLTESRSLIEPKMLETLKKLNGDIIIISGAEIERIRKQVPDLHYIPMAQSGAHTEYWQDSLTDLQFEEIKHYCEKLINEFPYFFKEPMFQDRGCQVTFGFLNPELDVEIKKLFDPHKEIRSLILKHLPFISLTGVEVKIAGTTSLDFVKKNATKGKNIEKMIEYKGWNKEDCVFYGDALEEGGNDHSVVGVIKTISVNNPEDLWKKLNQL